MLSEQYFLDADGKRVYLTHAETREEDALHAKSLAIFAAYKREMIALDEERTAFKARVLARAAAERDAKP